MKHILIVSSLCLLFVGCHTATKTEQVPNIIFETDMGNDVDDALALDMIYKYLDEGKINLLAVCSNKDSKYSTEYIHLTNHWYGYPNIPIGKVVNGIDCENDAKNYVKKVCLLKNENGDALFARPAFDYDAVSEAVSLYRKILSEQPDGSVTIVSVGFSTNIVRLLQSPPDQYSPLSGKELIAQKVKLLSTMAGSFAEKPIVEYNVLKDIAAAQTIAAEWTSPVVYSPFEVGAAILYPATVIENDFAWTKFHPVVEAYKSYLQMPYDRPTWDLTSLLYVVENYPEYFTISPNGTVAVDDKGYTTFTADKNGTHTYLQLKGDQPKKNLKRFIELTTRQPKTINN
ncbi:nucleoside hydrolase [Bacteroidia bacterium]|nr:nucleoside hydrolase [Bacteroidia bacterium]